MKQHTTGHAPALPALGQSRRLFIIALLLGVFSRGFAACYYIRPSGNDSNTGQSMTLAWKTIAKLNTINLLAGDSVMFEGGQSYPGTIMLNSSDGNNPNIQITISSFGMLPATIDAGTGKAIDLNNTQGIVIQNFILKGAGKSINTEDAIRLYTNISGTGKPKNIKLKDLEISGFGKTGITFGAWNGNAGFDDLLIDHVKIHDVLANGIVSYGYTSPTHIGWSHKNVIIRNCELYYISGFADASLHKGSGMILGQVDGGLIEHCVAHHNGTANIACGGPGGIWAYDSNNLTIQYCESYKNSAGTGCDGIGFDFDGGMTNSVIQYCYSHDNDGSGFLLGQYENARPWKNNVVRFNISVNDGRTNSGGISLFKGNGTTMYGADIYHNTVYFSKPVANKSAGAFTMVEWYTGIDSVRVMNNIFQTSGAVPVSWIPAGYSALMAGNQYWSGTGEFLIYDNNSQYTSLSAWRSATGNENFNGTISGVSSDPLLSNAGQSPVIWPSAPSALSNYKPAATSPAINAAIPMSAFGITANNFDFFAQLFPSGPQADIGAGEFYFAPVTPTLPSVPTAATLTPASATLSAGEADPAVTSTTESNLLNGIKIFPNPLTRGGRLYIEGIDGETRVEIFNMSGVKIGVFSGSVLESTDFLSQGIYVLRLIDSRNRFISKKLIVR